MHYYSQKPEARQVDQIQLDLIRFYPLLRRQSISILVWVSILRLGKPSTVQRQKITYLQTMHYITVKIYSFKSQQTIDIPMGI